jgi:hypothetical protein
MFGFQGPVKAFKLSVALRVVGPGKRMAYLQHDEQFLEIFRIKRATNPDVRKIDMPLLVDGSGLDEFAFCGLNPVPPTFWPVCGGL